MIGWSFHHYWGVAPEAYDVLADAAKQQLLKNRNWSDEQMAFLHRLVTQDTT
ncbi:hypothetical protein FN846DRAFT_903415 [Sphaerosporella brunnea]|uniref:Uncharacterized protein n=1 Tax=Sphaerosporella brunnea TaxID=1250544 RepID=A0A5J5F784_9PEZI|nr:hypothetical protein FN846DRAFT_903415 [Sphaerosporella brunnea]